MFCNCRMGCGIQKGILLPTLLASSPYKFRYLPAFSPNYIFGLMVQGQASGSTNLHLGGILGDKLVVLMTTLEISCCCSTLYFYFVCIIFVWVVSVSF